MKSTIALTGSLLAALAADAAGLSRQDLEKKLQAMEKAPAPVNLAPGAMCYKPAGPHEREEYVCPKCGEKTLYSRDAVNGWAAVRALESADAFRRLTRQLKDKGLDCRLDETAFCKKCGKEAKEKAFVLETRWPGQDKPHRTIIASTEDLTLILDFLSGKDRHDAGPDGEKPLKDHLPRIRELLGLNTGKAPEKKTP
jgi:ribosomal protein L37AE/L43A